MSRLSDLVSAALAKQRLSARQLAVRAREAGHTLNHDTAARYARGDHGSPDEATLVALHEVLGIPMKELRKAADLPSESTAPYTPPLEASRLTRRQRRAVDEIIRAMLEPEGRAGSRAAEPVAELDTTRAGARRAARHGKPEPPVD
jgi:transcriptional regulator with XRE-family HTH domain